MSELNLIPYSIKIKRENKKKYFNLGLLGIIIILIMLGGLYFPYATSENLKNEEVDLKVKINVNSHILTERDNLNSQINNINAHINNVNLVLKNKSNIFSLINGIHKSVPKDVVFSSLSYSVNVITINAVAKTYNSPEEFVANLQATKQYKNSKLLNLAVDEKNNVYSFSVKIDLRGGTL